MPRPKQLLICYALAIFAAPAIAFAAPPSNPLVLPAPSADAFALPPDIAAKADKRISELHAQLSITQVEELQWSSFVQIMRDNVAAMHKVIEERGTGMGKMSAVENMKSYAELARVYADNMQKLAIGADTLYGALSEKQKCVAESVFRNEQKRHNGMTREHVG